MKANIEIYKRPEVIIPGSITGEEKKLIQAFMDVRVYEASPREIKQAMEDTFLIAFDIGGYKLPEGETRDGRDRAILHLEILSAQCYNELADRHQSLTKAELKMIITNGARGDYGENHGITAAAFSRWVKGYLASKEVEDAKVEYGKLLKQANEARYIKTEPTPEEYSERFLIRLGQLFEIHKNKGSISETEGAFYFYELYRERYITFSDELRLELKQKAWDILRGKNNPDTALSKWEKDVFKAKIEDMKQLGIDHPAVVIHAKYLGLLRWFDDLIEMEVSIADVLNANTLNTL